MKHRGTRDVSRVCFVVLLVSAALAQQPVFQSETKLVLVDTVVTARKGEFVRDLTAKDFTIREDNKERPIRSFSLESAESHSEPHRFVLFFDNSNTSIPDQTQARQAAMEFVDTGAGALFAAISYDGVFRVVQPFTDSPARVKQSLSGIRLNALNATNQLATTADRAEAANTASADFRGLTESIANLARSLNALPGRKTLILFTAGTVISAGREGILTELVKLCNRANTAVYPIISTAPAPSAANQLDCGQRMPARLATTPPPGCASADTSVSDVLARGTGGFISTMPGDLPSLLKRIGSDETEHYVIGFEPLEADSKSDSCHELKVKVNRPGVSLRARSAYCASKPQDVAQETRIERDLEKHAAGTSSSDLTIEAPFFYPAPNVARVHVAAQIPASALRFDTAKSRMHVELNVLGIATAPDGAVAARFSDIVKRDYENKPQYLDYRREFRIVPGQYTLTLTFNGGADFGKAAVPLSIEPFDRSRAAISAIALGNDVRPADNIGLDLSFSGEGTPLIAGGMQIIQSATRAMDRTKPAFCYFEIYSPRAAEGAIVRVRITDATSAGEKWDGGEGRVTASNPSTGAIPVGLALPVSGLPPGKYRIDVTAHDAEPTTVARNLEFEIR